MNILTSMRIFSSRKEHVNMQKRCKKDICLYARNIRYNFFTWCINTEQDMNDFFRSKKNPFSFWEK